MRKSKPGPLLAALCMTAAMAWPRAAEARTRGKRVSTRILKSRRAVLKALGRQVARQLPAKLDFSKHALVWVDLRVVKKPKLRIVWVPPKRTLYLQRSSAQSIAVQRKPSSLAFTLASSSPCSGGMRKPRSQMLACHRAVAASVARAQKTLLLFATKRARLRRATVARKRMPGRP